MQIDWDMAIIVLIILAIVLFFATYDVINYPEKYFSTWRYQLKNDIARGDSEAIEYYNRNYVSKGIDLWGDYSGGI